MLNYNNLLIFYYLCFSNKTIVDNLLYVTNKTNNIFILCVVISKNILMTLTVTLTYVRKTFFDTI